MLAYKKEYKPPNLYMTSIVISLLSSTTVPYHYNAVQYSTIWVSIFSTFGEMYRLVTESQRSCTDGEIWSQEW